jgi:hypothetical protein
MYALNNLNIGSYSQEDLEQINGKKNWWTTREVMIALGAGVELDERGKRMDNLDNHVALELIASSKEPWDDHAQEYLNADGLMGMVFFFEPTEGGHWTAMRVENQGGVTFFTYSDSLRQGNDPEVPNSALTTHLSAPEMVEYLNNNEETTYGGNRWNTAIMVFQTVEQKEDFIDQIAAWNGKSNGKSKRKRKKRKTVDLAESIDKPKKKPKKTLHKKELIKVYIDIYNRKAGKSLSFDTMEGSIKEGVWEKIQKLFRKYARKAQKKHPDVYKEPPDINTGLNIKQKIKLLRKYVVLK